MKAFFQKGQISLFVAITGALGMIGASFVTSWATTYNKVSEVENKISIVEEREQNPFAELSKAIEKMDKKLDFILETKFKK